MCPFQSNDCFLGRGDIDIFVGGDDSMIAPHAGHELTHAHLDGTSDNIVEDLVLDLPSQITAEKIRLN